MFMYCIKMLEKVKKNSTWYQERGKRVQNVTWGKKDCFMVSFWPVLQHSSNTLVTLPNWVKTMGSGLQQCASIAIDIPILSTRPKYLKLATMFNIVANHSYFPPNIFLYMIFLIALTVMQIFFDPSLPVRNSLASQTFHSARNRLHGNETTYLI